MYFIKAQKGFTLVEMLVVVSVIVLLLFAGVRSLWGSTEKARDEQRVNDLNQIRLALRLYAEANDGYPTESEVGTDQGFLGVGNPIDTMLAPYLPNIPKDPFHDGINYYYYYDGYHGCTELTPPYNVAIYARQMETDRHKNRTDTCIRTDTEPTATGALPADEDTHVILLPAKQTFDGT